MNEPSPTPRRGITETDVWKAADTLLLEGRRPTIESVRHRIGRGSPNTITPYLDTWFKGLGRRLQDPAGYAAAPAVPEPIAAAATHFWESALSAARGELQGEREALAQATRALESERRELDAERERLAATEAALNEALALAKGELANATARGDRLVARNEALEAELLELKIQARRLAEALEAERAAREADAKRAEEAREAERARQEASHRRWMEETDAARTQARSATAERDRAAKALAAARSEMEQQRSADAERIVKLEASLAKSHAAGEALGRELQGVKDAYQGLQRQLAEAAERFERDMNQQRAQFAEAMRALGRNIVIPTLKASVSAATP